MRKMMTKEITKTAVKVGKVKVVNGTPEVEQLPEETLIGNVSLEKAQKAVNKKYDYPVTVFGVEPSTEVYEMAVETFLQHAMLKVEEPKAEQPETAEATA